jgi:nucleotidyltransferase substrate binding protein (TIGR01987 family)
MISQLDEEILDLTPLKLACAALERSLAVLAGKNAATPADEMATLRSGVIQNFEVAYELCWKSMKRWLEMNHGADAADVFTKKELFRKSAEAGLIADSANWFAFYRARNKTSHIYAEDVAEEVLDAAKKFMPDAHDFLMRLEGRG